MEDIPATNDSAVPHVFTASHKNETHEGAVDCDLIEQSKENVQPLRRGRDPHQLIKVLGHVAATAPSTSGVATPAPAAAVATAGCAVSRPEAVLKAERKALEGAIKSYSGDAPLTPWLAYLSWTRQNFLSASLASHMVPLLEKCTRTFLRDEKVNQTLAYLQLWFEYMDHVEDSLDMFAFLYANKIGLVHAQLYEGWALVLERRGRTQQALETLALGVDKHAAQPAWRIKDATKRMQARIAKQIAAAVAADPTAFNAAGSPASAGAGAGGAAGGHEARVSALAQRMADENGSVVRQPLGRLGAPAAPVRAVNGQTTYAPPPGTTTGIVAPRPAIASANSFATARRANGASAASSGSSSNFQVFCDDDAAAPVAAAAAPVASIAPVWNEYASASSIGKENRDKVGSWSEPLVAPAAQSLAEGTIIALPTPRPPAFDFPVFQDADCLAKQEALEASAGLADAAAQAASNPRKRLDAPLRATTDKAGHVSLAKLASQPLRNMTKPSSSSSSTSAAAAAAAPSSSSTSSRSAAQ